VKQKARNRIINPTHDSTFSTKRHSYSFGRESQK
jgi:hypothetical protein